MKGEPSPDPLLGSLQDPAEDPAPETEAQVARVVIADDHYLVRSGFRRMLATEPNVEVVAEAEDGRQALEVCRKLRPDLILMDVRMPEMDGLEATRAIKEELPTTSVLVVTTHENPEYLQKAMRAGAAGYILKDAPKRRLIDAIWRVLNGETPINQELAARLIRRLAEETKREAHREAQGEAQGGAHRATEGDAEPETRRAAEPSAPKPDKRQHDPLLGELTERELEVLRLLAQGKSNPQIARELVISRGTVKVHVQHIIAKLGVSDRTQAAIRAIDTGLIAL